MPILIKCHLNYFCQGYKKKLETSSLGHLLLIAIYESSVFWSVIHILFLLEKRKKETSKTSIGTPNGNVTCCPTHTLRSARDCLKCRHLLLICDNIKKSMLNSHVNISFYARFHQPSRTLFISLYFSLDFYFPGSKRTKITQNEHRTSLLSPAG